jgi:hypothetical protein
MGLLRSPDGGLVLGPGGGLLRRPGVIVVPERRVEPLAIDVLGNLTAGTKLADLVFVGFPIAAPVPGTEFTDDFTDEWGPPVPEFTGYDVVLTSDAGGRVALQGSWPTGYRLVVGLTALGGTATHTVTLQVGNFDQVFTITLRVTAVSSPTIENLYTARVENYDTVPSLASQEMHAGVVFKKGHVPTGTIVHAAVDGNRIPCQLSNRTYWPDGSLKHAQARWLMPVIAAGTGKDIIWQRQAGTWTAQDTGIHTSPTPLASKVAIEFAFTSWKGRTHTNVLTAEKGLKTFKLANMVAASNSAWFEPVMSGPVCTEWRISDMATLGTTTTKDPHFGCWLYLRAWGGTPDNPKRIQFLFKTIYGWQTNVEADQQGIQFSADVRVNATTLRGVTNGNGAWTNVRSSKGCFIASVGSEGKMDWFDLQANQVHNPPKLVYRHNVPYGIESRMFAPLDVNNPAFSTLITTPPGYAPMRRGLLRHNQSDVGDAEMITWGTSKPHARCIAAHARATAAQLANHEQAMRVTAWGMGAMHGQGYNRTTRKILCYLPPTRNPDSALFGPSIWTTADPPAIVQKANGIEMNPGVINGVVQETGITNLDAAHFPQINLWTYLSEGDQHFLDALYMEATLPGVFTEPNHGRCMTIDWLSTPCGGMNALGQVRAVSHNARCILHAFAMGNPADANYKLVKAYKEHWVEIDRIQPYQSGFWRIAGGQNGNNVLDGRRYLDTHLKENGTAHGGYATWMHNFGVDALSVAYGLCEDPDIKQQAEWWSYVPMVLAGGFHNDTDPKYYSLKCDPYKATVIDVLISSEGGGATLQDRRPWTPGQWSNINLACTYRTDNQTIALTSPGWDTTAAQNGWVITPTGITDPNNYLRFIDRTKIPAGLTIGNLYYSVQASSNTIKLALSPGGPPVTFNTGGVNINGNCIVNSLFGVPGHTFRSASQFQPDANSYFVHVISALDFHQWFVAPDDARIRLARNNLLSRKDAFPGSGYDVRGKTIVPR